jgi:hypothetical protein
MCPIDVCYPEVVVEKTSIVIILLDEKHVKKMVP